MTRILRRRENPGPATNTKNGVPTRCVVFRYFARIADKLLLGGKYINKYLSATFFNAQPLVQDYGLICDNYSMYKKVFLDHWVDWTIAIILMIFISVWGQILKTTIEVDQIGDEITFSTSQ